MINFFFTLGPPQPTNSFVLGWVINMQHVHREGGKSGGRLFGPPCTGASNLSLNYFKKKKNFVFPIVSIKRYLYFFFE